MWEQRPRRSKPGSANSPRIFLARDLSRSVVSPLRQVRLQKALRHPLDSFVPMRFSPPRPNRIKLEHPVLYRTMSAFTNVAHLNVPTCLALLIENCSSSKPDGIPNPLLRQSHTFFRVTEIAIVQFLLRWNLTFITGRHAQPIPTASQRKSRRMYPGSIFELLRRHKKWTRHYRLLHKKKLLRSAHSTHHAHPSQCEL
jgi:hypothetical protein